MISQETRNCNAFFCLTYSGGRRINGKLQLYIGVGVLAVLLRVFAVLNCKLWAAMQTAKAHHAPLFTQTGFFVFHPDRIYRAVSFAQAAANTAVLNAEMRGLFLTLTL